MLRKSLLSLTIAFSFSLISCNGFDRLKPRDPLAGQCVDKLRSSASLSSLAATKIDDRLCTEMTSYKCEKRVYGPNVSNRDSLVQECGSAGNQSACVSVRVLEFNTEVAREVGNENEFLPGGEYNRTDTQCVNRASQFKNISLIAGEGDDVFTALNSAISKCHERSHL